MRPRLLDLFCCAGGAGMGYYRAGFRVIGVDIRRRPDYPFTLWETDALALLANEREEVSDFHAIHASPPCQDHTTMSNRWRGAGGRADSHTNLIPAVRELLEATGKPWVIENVAGARAHMRAPITLDGGMFGLGVLRPRLFESNVALTPLPSKPVLNPLGVYGKSPDGRRLFTRKDGSIQRAANSVKEAGAAMGIDWMGDWRDICEAIPPAYTEHIGHQLLAEVTRRREVADNEASHVA